MKILRNSPFLVALIVLILSSFEAIISPAYAQVIHTLSFDRFSHYEADDWITYAYSNHITSIDIGPENVYFGTRQGGILRYNLFDETWLFPLTESQGLRSNRISNVVFDYASGQLFAKTDKGVDVFNLAFQYWQPTGDQLPDKKTAEYSRKNNSNDFRFPPFSRPTVNKWPAFFVNDGYELLLDGLILNPDNFEYRPTDRIVDNWYKLWIGTNGAGVGRADLDLLQLDFIQNSIPDIEPRDVHIVKSKIWVGGLSKMKNERGIGQWDLAEDRWTYFKAGIRRGLVSDQVYVICSIKNNVFFGTEQGLLSYNMKNERWKKYHTSILKRDRIYDLAEMNHLLFIASENGLFVLDTKSKIIDQLGSPSLNQTKISNLAGADSLVFAATVRGIYKFNINQQTTELLKSRTAIADNFITALGFINDSLWFSSAKGIGLFDIKQNSWKSFPAINLDINTNVKDIKISDNHIWFATQSGLLKYDSYRDYWYLYTREDGLADNRIYNIEIDNDYLWLATDKGITRFRWYSEDRFE